MKAANQPFVPIVGADNAGFVTQLLDRPTGLEGRGRDQPAGRRRRRRRPRPSSSSPARSPQTTTVHVTPELVGQHDRRGQGRARRRLPNRSSRSSGRSACTIKDWTDLHRGRPHRLQGPGRVTPPRTASPRSGVSASPARPLRSTIHRPTGPSMTDHRTDLLLEATGVAKSYGAVVGAALGVAGGPPRRGPCADGRQRRRQEHARQDPDRAPSIPTAARSLVRGEPYVAHSPAEARRGGVVSVYQEPALIPDLDIRSNLRLTETPVEPFRHWLAELGIGDLDLSDMARRSAAGHAPRHRPRARAGDRAATS